MFKVSCWKFNNDDNDDNDTIDLASFVIVIVMVIVIVNNLPLSVISCATHS